MENKSTLGPLFVLAFLGMIVLFCIVLSVSSIMLGTAFSFKELAEGGSLIVPSRITQVESAELTQTNPTLVVVASPQIESTASPQILPPTLEPSLTPIPTESLLPTTTPLPSEVPTQTIAPTATIDQKVIEITKAAQETAQVEGMMQLVDQLYGNGLIPSREGRYHSFPIYANESANTAVLDKYSTGLNIKDFVLRAEVNWQVDQNQGDWVESGCGVIFRESDPANFYLVYLSLDGRARLVRKIDGSNILLGRSTIFNVDRQNGQAQLLLVVKGDMIRIFVDGEKKYEKPGDPRAGDLSFTVITGNPYGYGTRCKMSNIEVWEIEPQ